MTRRAQNRKQITRLYAAPANAPDTCLMADSPHSGRNYPSDFNFACDFQTLRQAEDVHVDKLFSFLPQLGVPLLTARVPRSYVDLNRADSVSTPWQRANAKGEDPDYTPQEGGLIRSPATPRHSEPVYNRTLKLSEAFNRVARCHRPYHARLAALIGKTAARHGAVMHLNLHSMPSTIHRGTKKNKYDIILGTRDGETADDHLTQKLRALLEAKEYKVGINVPGFRGAEIVRRHANPAQNRHSIQIEINRALYMNEKTLRRLPRAVRLQDDLRSALESFRSYCDATLTPAQKHAPKQRPPRR
jgi:N-formylglutamate deformylase